MRIGGEPREFVAGEGAALELEAQGRGRGEFGEVAGYHRAKISLGVDVKLSRNGDLRAEDVFEKRRAGNFVTAVNAALGEILGNVLKDVSDVVEQGGQDQGVARPIFLRQKRRLEGMLRLGNALAEIGVVALALKESGDCLVSVLHDPGRLPTIECVR